MMHDTFKWLSSTAKNSLEGRTGGAKFFWGRFMMRVGRASALAACLLSAAPPMMAPAAEPFPSSQAGNSETPAQPSLEQLIASLKSEDARVRKTAAETLTWQGAAAQPAIPQLLMTLRDQDSIVRATAARAVWEIDQQANEAVPVLVELLESKNASHRELAAYFLGPMGHAAKTAVPALRAAINDKDPAIQIHAAEALAQIEPVAADSVAVLVGALTHESPNVRSLAAMAFSNVAPIHANQAVPALTKALVDPDFGVRTSAEMSLTTFNLDVATSNTTFPPAESHPLEWVNGEPVQPTAENTTPFAPPLETPVVASPFNVLPKANSPATGSVEDSAQHPLAVSSELAEAVKELSHDNPAIRKSALERISWMGQQARPVLSEVSYCLSDARPDVRAYAAKTVFDVDPQSAPASVMTLQTLLDSTQPGIRPLAAFYLGYIGPQAASALPTLKRALANTAYTEQLQIAEAIARINPEDSDAVTVLLGGLRDPENQVRFQAAYALGEVSPKHAERVIPELATAMRDQSEQVQTAAKLAMLNFQPAPEEAPASDLAPNPASQPVPAILVKTQPQPVESIEEPSPTNVRLLDPEPIAQAPAYPHSGVESIVPPQPEDPGTVQVLPLPGEAVVDGPPPMAPPKRENRLGLGEDYKPIHAVNVTITPKRRDNDGQLLQLPTNYGAAWLRELGTHHQPTGTSRPWTIQSAKYAASGFCHRPLYFEEINLERYGHNFGPVIQPFVSAAAFYGRVPLMPYMMAADHPWDCQYTLGHYRPGNCVPFRVSHLPRSTPGTLLEAGIITGLFFAIY